MEQAEDSKLALLPEHPHHPRQPIMRYCQETMIPAFVCDKNPKVTIIPCATLMLKTKKQKINKI